MMQSSQYLRQKMESATKRIGPRVPGDASLITQMRRFGASVRLPNQKYSSGNMTQFSSETITAQKANCSICEAPAQLITVIECPCPSVSGTPYPINGWQPPKPWCCTGEVNGPPARADPAICCPQQN